MCEQRDTSVSRKHQADCMIETTGVGPTTKTGKLHRVVYSFSYMSPCSNVLFRMDNSGPCT